MSAIVHSKTSDEKEEKSTNVGRFLAKRGVLLANGLCCVLSKYCHQQILIHFEKDHPHQ